MTQNTQTPPALGVPVGTWTVDPAASELGFAVRTFWGALNVKGVFERFTGTLEVSGDDAQGSLQIEAASLNTNNSRRDEHLRSEHFFDVQRNSAPRLHVDSLSPGPVVPSSPASWPWAAQGPAEARRRCLGGRRRARFACAPPRRSPAQRRAWAGTGWGCSRPDATCTPTSCSDGIRDRRPRDPAAGGLRGNPVRSRQPR